MNTISSLLKFIAYFEPLGSVKMYAGSSAPDKWLICDGSAVSRTTYAKLFDVIGTTYGAGDGSTTFNLPDFSGRVPIGVSGTHALASTGGAETVTLTTSEIPAHTHGSKTLTGSFWARKHSSGSGDVGANSGICSDGTGGGSFSGATANTSYTHTPNTVIINATHEHTSVGGSGSHNNMQPFITVNYIIYAGQSNA